MSATLAPPPPAPDALIEEARRRHRRRRRRVAAVLVVAALAAAVSIAVLSRHGTGVVHVAGGPTVNVAAFAGHGRLAFVSGRTLWVLDGERGTLRKIAVPHGRRPLQPSFSRDGRRLAFVATTTPPLDVPGAGAPGGDVWLANGDGADAHPLRGLSGAQPIGWSSHSDTLAALGGPISTRVPFESETTIRLVTADGRTRVLLRARSVQSAAWSPDGRQLAVLTEDGHLHETLASYPLDGGRRTVWARFGPRTHLNGMTQIVADIAGWWRGFGIAVWIFGDGAVHDNDETPLDVVSTPGAEPRRLADTLSDGTTRVAAAVGRRLALVADVSGGYNGGRVVWDAKQLQLCAPRASCRAVDPNPLPVTFDPAWSPDGRLLAYVAAPDLTSSGWQQRVLKGWYRDHVLRVLDVRTGRTRTVAAARGATVPLWSADGRGLLYVDGDGISLLPRLDGRPVEIARPLFRGLWPSYFGQMAWPAQFAWWPR